MDGGIYFYSSTALLSLVVGLRFHSCFCIFFSKICSNMLLVFHEYFTVKFDEIFNLSALASILECVLPLHVSL